jgi:glycosyltransferase involved in cell wall biosynthesis
MRVLYSRTQAALGHTTGGALAHTLGVIGGFAQSGSVAVLANEPIHGIDRVEGDLTVTVIPARRPGGFGELLYNFRYPPHLKRMITEFRPEGVYHRAGGLSYATARVCKRLGVPLILEFNSSPVWGLHQRADSLKKRILAGLKIPILRQIESYNLRATLLIVVPGKPLMKHLIQRGIPEEKLLFNPNAVNPDKFQPAGPDVCRTIREQLNISPDRTIVGFAGSFSSWHGIPELAEAINRLNADPQRRQKLFFVLCGDGRLRPVIEDNVGHYENVSFTGEVEYTEIQDYLSICDILVSPHGQPSRESRSMGWPGASPTKVFEYMALGKAIVASELDYIGEVIRNGETGVSVPAGDVNALVEGIAYLTDNPDQARRLGRNAQAEVRKHHTWESHVQRIIKRFEQRRRATHATA